MRKAYLVSIILFLAISCSETYKIQTAAKALADCENKWRYFDLSQPIKGVVLLHTKGYCGYIHLHSNTIVLLNNTDTVRIDGPCYTANVAISDSVLISPYKTDNVKGAIGDGIYDCTIMKTCYGIIKKIK